MAGRRLEGIRRFELVVRDRRGVDRRRVDRHQCLPQRRPGDPGSRDIEGGAERLVRGPNDRPVPFVGVVEDRVGVAAEQVDRFRGRDLLVVEFDGLGRPIGLGVLDVVDRNDVADRTDAATECDPQTTEDGPRQREVDDRTDGERPAGDEDRPGTDPGDHRRDAPEPTPVLLFRSAGHHPIRRPAAG
ncbi:hypothetical protein ACFQL1_04690 [Halomicroarcula sp. GCM10025709]|uniref:hypothetical protein n=1 Tax=Halomicroarcula sp. GCM10025709 TaxID=3252669 RepID=UPI00360F8C15